MELSILSLGSTPYSTTHTPTHTICISLIHFPPHTLTLTPHTLTLTPHTLPLILHTPALTGHALTLYTLSLHTLSPSTHSLHTSSPFPPPSPSLYTLLYTPLPSLHTSSPLHTPPQDSVILHSYNAHNEYVMQLRAFNALHEEFYGKQIYDMLDELQAVQEDLVKGFRTSMQKYVQLNQEKVAEA